MYRKYAIILPMLALIIAALACEKTPTYKLRGWTVTPSPSSTMPATLPLGPTIIYVTPTYQAYRATVIVDIMEIRSGPGTNYPARDDLYLKRGDIIMVTECRYDKNGEAWAHWTWAHQMADGWSAITWRGDIFLSPMPGRCEK